MLPVPPYWQKLVDLVKNDDNLSKELRAANPGDVNNLLVSKGFTPEELQSIHNDLQRLYTLPTPASGAMFWLW